MTTIPIDPCPACAGRQGSHVFSKNGFHLVRCQACQQIFVSPLPSDQELIAHYQNPTYFSGEETQGYRDYADMEKALLPHFQRRIALLNTRLPNKGCLLDFGCAAGYFLQVACEHGWQIAGVELSSEMATQAATRLQIPIATSLATRSVQSVAAVTLWEVIEHLPRPVEQLRELLACLQPGGALMLSTPNTGHWKALRQPDQWEGYRPPSHLQFFTRQTLANVLVKAGFERIEIQGTAPLPPLPSWLERASRPLYRSLASGQAPQWRSALYAWRAVRLLGWGWQKIAHPQDDIFATLEAIAFRPV